MTSRLWSPFLEAALRYAALAHQDQRRKGSDTPYITHPVQVATILERAGFTDETLLAAAMLHDVVEDCDITHDQLREEFGSDVADIVAALSERKTDDTGHKRPWEDRKCEHLEHLTDASLAVRALTLADKLHNLETIALDLKSGTDVWSRFNAPKERLLWYYGAVVDRCGSDAPELSELARACRDALGRLATDADG